MPDKSYLFELQQFESIHLRKRSSIIFHTLKQYTLISLTPYMFMKKMYTPCIQNIINIHIFIQNHCLLQLTDTAMLNTTAVKIADLIVIRAVFLKRSFP